MRPRLRAVLTLVAALSLGEVTFAATPDPALLGRWYAAGLSALAEGRAAQAAEIAAAALDAAPQASDFRWLATAAAFALDGDREAAVAGAEAALLQGTFDFTEADDVRCFEAERLLELRRHVLAQAVLGRLRAPEAAPALLLRVRALLAEGRTDRALDLLEKAQRLFPGDARFALLFFSSSAYPSDARTRGLARFWLSYRDWKVEDRAAVLLKGLPYVAALEERVRNLRILRADPPGSPELQRDLAVQSLIYGLSTPEVALAEYFAVRADLDLASLEELRDAMGGGSALSALADRLASWTGRLAGDVDGDLVREYWGSYENGLLTAWSLDADQDGVIETRVDFGAGEALRALVRHEAGMLELTWAFWPWLERVEDRPPTQELPVRTWSLPDGGLGFRPFALRPFIEGRQDFLVARPASDQEIPTERSLMTAATAVRLAFPASVFEFRLEQGVVIEGSFRSATGAAGHFAYTRGRPQTEELDQDGDGRFETKVELAAASDPFAPLALRSQSDLDGDGYAEVSQTFDESLRTVWDFDKDGRPDIAESRLSDGGLLREFAGRPGGPLDESVRLAADGSVRAVTRKGAAQPLTPDAHARIIWAGLKPFDLGPSFVPSSGTRTIQGRSVRLQDLGDFWLAELQP